MGDVDHRKQAQDFAQLSLTGNYVNEEYPQRLVAIAQAHAILAVADAIEDLIRRLASTPDQQP